MEKKIEIRPMTMMEYDALSDYAEELKSKNYTEDKQSRKLAMFVCEKIAGMDLQDKSATIKKVMSVYEQIMKATNDEQLEEEKN